MRVRQTLLIVATGVFSGAVGAVVVGHFQSPPPPQAAAVPTASRPVEAPRPLIIPPGWTGFEARLNRVEQQLNEDRSARSEKKKTEDVDPKIEQREEERLQHYKEELAYQQKLVRDHDREAPGGADARQAAQSLQEAFTRTTPDSGFSLQSIDCREDTCIARMAFATPLSGLSFVQSKGVPMVAECHGQVVVPPPPNGDGAYELSTVYFCGSHGRP